MKLILEMFVVVALTGCATPAVQTKKFFKTEHNIAATKLIREVPFINQEAGQCGPATLTMAMNWAGKPVTVQEILPQVYNAKMKGSLQNDMMSSSRRNGLMAIPLTGLEALLAEVDSGHPVIVFENLALTWLPQWHYAIVIGYDLPLQKIILHSGPEAFKYWDMQKFERSWMLGDYWGLVVLPPDQLSITGDEVSHVTSASALEQVGQLRSAEVAYQTILKKWPESLGALIGLGNISFENRNYKQSIQYLTEATKFYPDSAFAWHNLAVAQGNANLRKQAKVSAMKALKLASTENYKSFEANLSEWINQ